jgi:S1-C subfamily serine protease
MTLTPSIAEILREAGAEVSVDQGLLVLETQTGGPANEAGIQGANRWVRIGRRIQLPVGGDIITAIDG